MGVSKVEILESEPRELWCYEDAYHLKMQKMDEEAWIYGKYFAEAIMSTIGNAFKEKGEPNYEYPKKPYLFDIAINDKNSNSKEECAVYEMKQRIKMLEKTGLPMSPV